MPLPTDIALTPIKMQTLFQSVAMAILKVPIEYAGDVVSGSNLLAVPGGTSGMSVGNYVSDQQGAIQPKTQVTAVAPNQLTLNNNATANVTNEFITVSDFSQVRIDWQTTGQPMMQVTDDVCFLRALEIDNPYDRNRDVVVSDYDDDNVQFTTTYTRVWEIYFTLYGPNSFDRARILRSGMFIQDYHDTLAQSSVYFVTDPAPPRRVPDQRDGQWWERTDWGPVLFNEAVTEYRIVPAVDSVEILIETKRGLAADFTITKGQQI